MTSQDKAWLRRMDNLIAEQEGIIAGYRAKGDHVRATLHADTLRSFQAERRSILAPTGPDKSREAFRKSLQNKGQSRK